MITKFSRPDATTMTKGRIAYATTTIAGAGLGERVPHRTQSQAASTLLASLVQGDASASSKSHSRALVAAATGDAPSLKLGIDVEWRSADRPFTAIMQNLVPSLSCPLDCKSFYRGWTFLEAYYKAFQELPLPLDIETTLAPGATQVPQVISNGAFVLHQSVLEAFELCLVWKSYELCAVEYRRQ